MFLITVLAGGTGSVKLVRGIAAAAKQDVAVISNVGDNIWLHGLYVCPDIDTIISGLAGLLVAARIGHVTEASLADNIFYLSSTDPRDDAIIYWSALKARLQVDAGRSDPSGMIIQPAQLNSDGCREG